MANASLDDKPTLRGRLGKAVADLGRLPTPSPLGAPQILL